MKQYMVIFGVFLLSMAGLGMGCGSKSQDSSADTASQVDSAVGDTIADEDVKFVTIGVFTKDEQGNYVDSGKTLYFEVGVPCYSWTRSAQPHEQTGYLEAVDEVHDHYNAGDETSYVAGVFTWTEYGPEHTQADVDAVCAAGEDGVTKSVTADDYYEDHGGLYLRIISLE